MDIFQFGINNETIFNMKKIVSFKKLEHIVPGSSCGTGYSEPDKFEVTLDNGKKYKVLSIY